MVGLVALAASPTNRLNIMTGGYHVSQIIGINKQRGLRLFAISIIRVKPGRVIYSFAFVAILGWDSRIIGCFVA